MFAHEVMKSTSVSVRVTQAATSPEEVNVDPGLQSHPTPKGRKRISIGQGRRGMYLKSRRGTEPLHTASTVIKISNKVGAILVAGLGRNPSSLLGYLGRPYNQRGQWYKSHQDGKDELHLAAEAGLELVRPGL